jgi:hypothetical protein
MNYSSDVFDGVLFAIIGGFVIFIFGNCCYSNGYHAGIDASCPNTGKLECIERLLAE